MRQCAQAALAIASLTLCLTAGSPVAMAQVRGIPVNNSGVASGIALYGDVGFPDAQAGKGTAYALTGRRRVRSVRRHRHGIHLRSRRRTVAATCRWALHSITE